MRYNFQSVGVRLSSKYLLLITVLKKSKNIYVHYQCPFFGFQFSNKNIPKGAIAKNINMASNESLKHY